MRKHALIFSFILIGFSGQAFSSPTAKTLGQILEANGGKLPVPFEKLMSASGGGQGNIVLIPKGRSKVKNQTDFKNPRILFNPSSETKENPTKLIIGYTPVTDSMEIMTWNPVKKDYDFIEVKDYSKQATQKFTRPHAGDCIKCHADSRLLFAPSPWGEALDSKTSQPPNLETRERDVPTKIYEELKGTKGYPLYFGVDLEKYKTASSKNVGNFFNSISRSESGRRAAEICSKVCQSGIAKDDLDCRRLSLKNALSTALFPDKEPEINDRYMANEKAVSEISQREKKRLGKATVRSNNFLIPDRDPFTDEEFRPALSEADQAIVVKAKEDFKKNNPGQKFPPRINLIKMTAEELRDNKIGDNIVRQEEISEDEIRFALNGAGCLQLNAEQLADLSTLNADALSALVEKSPNTDIDAFLKDWPMDSSKAISTLGKTQNKTFKSKDNIATACLSNLEAAISVEIVQNLSPLQAPLLLLLPKEEQAQSFNAYCITCHNVDGSGETVLPFQKVIAGDNKGAEILQDEMIYKLTNCKMPPEGEPQPPIELRKKMIEALGGKPTLSEKCK